MIEGIDVDNDWNVQVVLEPQEGVDEQEQREAVERIVKAVFDYVRLTQSKAPAVIILINRVTPPAPPVSVQAPAQTPMQVEETFPVPALSRAEVEKMLEKLQERVRLLRDQLAQEQQKLKTGRQMEVLRQVSFAPADKTQIESSIAKIEEEIRVTELAIAGLKQTLQDIK